MSEATKIDLYKLKIVFLDTAVPKSGKKHSQNVQFSLLFYFLGPR